MSVHKKLMEARIRLQNTKLSKSGHNKFAGYKYFELGDFLPAIQDIFSGLGLCGVVSYTTDIATLTITDTETGTELTVTSPMSTAALKGCHEVQNLGAVQTYIRRYLWVTALEIVEHDALDATLGASDSKPEPRPDPKPVKKAPLPVNQPTNKSWAISIGDETKWVNSVVQGSSDLLQFAESKNDVVEIFKVNRQIFDRLMVEDKATYDDLMAVFAEYKTKFAE
jgi:hypothetical protein